MPLKTDKKSTTGIILHHTTTGFKFLSCRKTGLCRPPGVFTLSEVDRDIQRLSQEELFHLILKTSLASYYSPNQKVNATVFNF